MEAQLSLSVAGSMGKDLEDEDFLKPASMGFRLVNCSVLILNMQGLIRLPISQQCRDK